ncbi:MAG: hypothetical protein VXY67_04870, partial [Candidatus Thermoplasmatota archaeon]|nr:hypothetical protein [Candidatus Thermoplasmatota archaeon]
MAIDEPQPFFPYQFLLGGELRRKVIQMGGGRWGVVPASQHQEILVALASLIRAQRYEMALTILGHAAENRILPESTGISSLPMAFACRSAKCI